MRLYVLFGLGAVVLSALAEPACAQIPQPLPRAVFDFRGFMTTVGQDTTTAFDLNVPALDLPNKVRGFTTGGVLYVKRGPGVGIGFGGELTLGRGRMTTVDPAGATDPVKTATRFTGYSGNLTLNFGARDGWSYLTAGGGPMQLWSYLDGTTNTASPPRMMTLNAGFGARWFAAKHVAFTFDVRFYYTKGIETIDGFPGRGKRRLVLLSAGISIR